jgi:hypothetical protein
MLPGCCPSCGFSGDLEAFLIEPEAKRAIARVAALEPALGRVLGPYLRLFGNGKRGVQLRRAVKLIDELVAMVDVGSVCRDERVGVRRKATPAMWAAGVEQVVSHPPSGALQNHHYLRAVVFGIADAADAAAERAAEAGKKAGRHLTASASEPPAVDRTAERRAFAARMLDLGEWSQEKADEYVKG